MLVSTLLTFSGIWSKYPQTYLLSYSTGTSKYDSLEDAKAQCLKRNGLFKINGYKLIILGVEPENSIKKINKFCGRR